MSAACRSGGCGATTRSGAVAPAPEDLTTINAQSWGVAFFTTPSPTCGISGLLVIVDSRVVLRAHRGRGRFGDQKLPPLHVGPTSMACSAPSIPCLSRVMGSGCRGTDAEATHVLVPWSRRAGAWVCS